MNRADSGNGRKLAALCLVQFMIVLDQSIANIALPTIGTDLAMPASMLQWVVSAYSLLLASFLIVGGRMGDGMGHRNTLLAGLVVFTVCSLVAGITDSGIMLIVMRGGQGLGAALMSPSILALIALLHADPAERGKAFAAFGGVSALGFSSGTLLGGVLTEYLGWRSVFLINIPIGLMACAFCLRFIQNKVYSAAPASVNALNATLAVAGIALVLNVVTQYNGEAMQLPTFGFALAGGAALLAFAWREKASANPIIPRGFLLENRPLVAASVSGALFGAAIAGSLYLVTIYLQSVLKLSPSHTGLSLLPHALVVVPSSVVMAKLMPRFGPERLLAFGLFVMTIGLALMLPIRPTGSYWIEVLPATLLMGVAVAAMMVCGSTMATHGLPENAQGLATGIFTTSQHMGVTVGLVLCTALSGMMDMTLSGASNDALTGGLNQVLLTAIVFAALALLACLGIRSSAKAVSVGGAQ